METYLGGGRFYQVHSLVSFAELMVACRWICKDFNPIQTHQNMGAGKKTESSRVLTISLIRTVCQCQDPEPKPAWPVIFSWGPRKISNYSSFKSPKKWYANHWWCFVYTVLIIHFHNLSSLEQVLEPGTEQNNIVGTQVPPGLQASSVALPFWVPELSTYLTANASVLCGYHAVTKWDSLLMIKSNSRKTLVSSFKTCTLLKVISSSLSH